MTRIIRVTALFLVLAAVAAVAESAGSFYNKGKDAEARQDYEAAYTFYKQAYDLKPKDLTYRASYERTKFLAGASHVHRGQLLRDQGKLEEALAEFQKAAAIDPSSPIAQQEIRRTQEEIDRKQPGQPQPPPAPSQLRQRVEQAQGLIELTPVSDQPITLRLTEDSKVVYETIGKLAGINVLFDPDYTSRRIHIELNGVSLIDALELVAMESKTFWRPVTVNTIFVAADTPAKRKELEQNIIKTFYLSNLSQPTELQDVVNTLRTILEVSRITQMPSQGAIIVRGTPDQVALAEKLIGDLDKARPEVIVEVAVMQVTREKIRNLGISPPTSATVALNSNITTSTNNNNSNNNNTGSASNTVNLNRIGNLTAKDFLVTIPSASVTALFSDSNSKLIQNPQIRALDGQKASLKIGDRVPVATGSFGAGIGGVGLNSLVNTQFQYIDVGVNIDITPKVHQNREITLKISMDISQVTGQTNIGGIDQPTIGQRKIEHEIRLKEGEVNMLGGLFEESDVKSLSGWPWVSQVPLLRYLFSTEKVDRRRNELVFVLIPHIVRAQELTNLNMRPLDVGTGNVIDLRMGAKPKPTGAPVAAPQTPSSQPQQPAAQPPAQQPAAQQPAPAPAATLQLELTGPPPAAGSTFSVNVNMLNGQNVYSVPVQMTYDPKFLQLVNVSNGNFLSQGGQAVALAHRDGDGNGTLQVTAERPPNSGGASGSGTIFTLTFMAKAPGDSTLTITRAGVKDAQMNSLPVSTGQTVVSIKP